MRKLFAIARCPSVCASVRPTRSCIQMAEDIVKLLSRSGSPITLVTDFKRRYPISRGTPPAGVLDTPGWENFVIFD